MLYHIYIAWPKHVVDVDKLYKLDNIFVTTAVSLQNYYLSLISEYFSKNMSTVIKFHQILDFKLSPRPVCNMLSFG